MASSITRARNHDGSIVPLPPARGRLYVGALTDRWAPLSPDRSQVIAMKAPTFPVRVRKVLLQHP